MPVVFGGTDELYLRRHIEVRVIGPILPPTRTSRAAISAWTSAFHDAVQTAAEDVHRRATASNPRRKRWRWLTGNYPRV